MTEVENLGQISHFFTLSKIRGGMGEMFESVCRACRASPSSQQLWSFIAFSVAGPAIWNSDSLRDPAISRDSFKCSLKTFLFSAYSCT